jgi:hypothetical protein
VSRQAVDEIAAAPTVTHFTLDAVARCVEVRVWLAACHGGLRRDRYLTRSFAGLRAVQRAFPVAEPRARLMQGYWHRVCGKADKACLSFERSLARARQLHLRYDEARALLALGGADETSSQGTSPKTLDAAVLLRELGADREFTSLL